MEAPSLEELDTLKYSELRRLAKAAGLKANLKADRLLRALKKHFHPALITDNNGSDSDSNATLTDDSQVRPDEEEQISTCHVTHRRGRGKKETLVDSSPEMEHKVKAVQADEVGSDVPVLQNQQSSDGNTEDTARRQSKRRRCSGKKTGKNIPKSAAVSKSGSKPSTPNFKRMHEAHFKKMESIDKYLERKQKRLDAISSSIQEVKMLTKNSNQQKTPSSNRKKSLQNRFSLLSPVPQIGNLFSAKTPANPQSGRKRSCLVDKSGVKPSTYSSSKMNVRFSGATKDNEHKYSLVKTPARKSSTFVPSTNSEPRKSLPLSSIKATKGPEDMNLSAVTTPFKFTAQNMETPKDAKKMKFDLQASLARPLGYQPHKGKLKPWGDTKENKEEEPSKSSILKNTYKQPPVSTRDSRRKQQERDRKTKRDKTLGSRRGVAVP
ncbi:nucleolar and spindle-associated protein 1 isoform X2 [Bufo gargarizans]|uniref:nucleolar and spindle-associated protein 1 isoform X2 n=1 Tax=Bufo gargarizans TaxID=30331 RepID=UPI001CF2AE62|nr:nucleolar and spindle-associated protein 1 isoform X2 [Bufo gargarizans]